MLSQNLAKNMLLLNSDFSAPKKAESWKELAANYYLLIKAHQALQYGDATLDIPPQKLSPAISGYFKEVEPYYTVIANSCADALNNKNDNSALKYDLGELLNNEKQFLALMQKITFQFDAEAKAEVTTLKHYELFFLAVTLLTLLMEGLFIFRPIIKHIKKNIEDYNT
jgi:hypothetical protein